MLLFNNAPSSPHATTQSFSTYSPLIDFSQLFGHLNRGESLEELMCLELQEGKDVTMDDV